MCDNSEDEDEDEDEADLGLLTPVVTGAVFLPIF